MFNSKFSRQYEKWIVLISNKCHNDFEVPLSSQCPTIYAIKNFKISCYIKNCLTFFYIMKSGYTINIRATRFFGIKKQKAVFYHCLFTKERFSYYYLSFQKRLMPIAIMNLKKLIGQKAMNHYMEHRIHKKT